MDERELTLLDGALPCARALLLYGLESSESDVAATLARRWGSVDRLDWRISTAPASELRAELRQRWGISYVRLACVGAVLPVSVAEIVPEIERGELVYAEA